MPTEAFGFNEGNAYLYTGAGATSAVAAFAQNVQGSFFRGWVNHPALSGNQVEYLTGKRVDVTLGAVYTNDATIVKMIESATAIHMKLIHTHDLGSGGMFLYSGRVDTFQLAGTERNPYVWTIQYHAYNWSAF